MLSVCQRQPVADYYHEGSGDLNENQCVHLSDVSGGDLARVQADRNWQIEEVRKGKEQPTPSANVNSQKRLKQSTPDTSSSRPGGTQAKEI